MLGNSLNIYQRMSYIVFGVIFIYFIFFLGGGGGWLKTKF